MHLKLVLPLLLAIVAIPAARAQQESPEVAALTERVARLEQKAKDTSTRVLDMVGEITLISRAGQSDETTLGERQQKLRDLEKEGNRLGRILHVINERLNVSKAQLLQAKRELQPDAK